MTVRSIQCPKCGGAMNVPAAMQTIRCSGCGHVFAAGAARDPGSGPPSTSKPSTSKPSTAKQNTNDDAALSKAAGAEVPSNSDSDRSNQVFTYVASAGAFVFLAFLGLIGVFFLPTGSSDSDGEASENLKPVFQPATEDELAGLTIVNIPEERRRRIYDDMRTTARMTTEKPLMIPGGKVRASMEGMLESVSENSIQQLAALHDLRIDDIRHIIEEGDLKNWDPRARSRAYRGGERVNSNEKAQGYQTKNPIL